MSTTIVTFGEIMARLSPPGYQRLIQTRSLELTFGGGEANVAVSLAQLGQNARFVSVLPDNDLGRACRGELARYGVDVSHIAMAPGRMGLYYCEKGASQRPSKVIYDRAGSAVACAQPSIYSWEKALDGVSWLHFTGITPAISDNAAAATMDAVKAAKKAGATVSCDLNYRKKLWSREKAGRIMTELMPYVDLLIANEEDAADVFGIQAEATDITRGVIDQSGYESVARQLCGRFSLSKVAITLRESISASRNGWSAMLFSEGRAIHSKRYDIQIVDRVGGGDSFAAGLIYGLSTGMSDSDALEFAVAASCLKHTVEGDFNLVSRDEVLALAGGDGSGRVQR